MGDKEDAEAAAPKALIDHSKFLGYARAPIDPNKPKHHKPVIRVHKWGDPNIQDLIAAREERMHRLAKKKVAKQKVKEQAQLRELEKRVDAAVAIELRRAKELRDRRSGGFAADDPWRLNTGEAPPSNVEDLVTFFAAHGEHAIAPAA